ncbi:hypothetical protein FE773_07795 [Caminibacter mediatlanticus TB-2]|uniref:SLH domain-containing protein n=1 Tax=Caminibacter mediatlanticus TB-2 TaxID=391592 RepID=A0ABX5VD97_9BACT|nr:hypothetical protein [Caminibacter mediatlanticus]QCT95094.1 hypothetical protein FE773_07795 [Caminibacter mediatlanticus TB-2]
MKINKILIIFFFILSALNAATWQVIPDHKWVYSTNSGIKLKAAAGISEQNKRFCVLIEKEDGSEFKYSGEMFIKFSDGDSFSSRYMSGDNKVFICKYYDMDVAEYTYPFNYLSQGKLKVWVKSDNGDYFSFPDFILKAVNPIKITNFTIQKIKNDDNYNYFKMNITLSQRPIVIKIETNSGSSYYFLKNGNVPYINDKIFYKYIYSNNYKDWTIFFKIYKNNEKQHKWFKLIVQDYRAKSANELVDSQIKYFDVDRIDYIKIKNFSISKINETNAYVDYKAEINLSTKPKVVKIETDNKNIYYFLKDGIVQTKPDFVTAFNYSDDYKNWLINFRIYKNNKIQNKWFKLIVQDYRAKNSNDLVDYKIYSFNVLAKDSRKSSIHIKVDSNVKKIPATFIFTVKTDYKVNVLKVTSSKGESKIRLRDGYGTFGNIQIKPINNYTWKVTYTVNSLYLYNAKENNVTLNFYLLSDDLKHILGDKSIKIKVYRDTSEEDFSNILSFLNKSQILKKLDLGNKNVRFSPISRAEAALIIYEFLKLKNPNFKLPFNIALYSNPFADVDKNTNYYNAVITLTNYKGDDNISVLTTKYGVFNPLDYVTRFQFVKMIIEGLNIPKSYDFSNIKNFSDYNLLGNDAKIYFSTAIKNGIIRGDNNKLLPYQKLTVFQALTILDRIKNYKFDVNNSQFNLPNFSYNTGSELGIIPDYQKYNPSIKPIKIINVSIQKEGNCNKLIIKANFDKNSSPYYKWTTNFGYFKKVNENNSQVIFCPSTKKPDVDYTIKVIGNDGYFNFDEYRLTLNKNNFSYKNNIADNNSTFVNFDINLSVPNKVLKENKLYILNKRGSLYKGNLNIGLERINIILSDNNTTYNIENVNWNNNQIYFVVPSIPAFYGKTLTMKVIIASNDKFREYNFHNIRYEPIYAIEGIVSINNEGDYPDYVFINGKKVVINNGKFYCMLDKVGDYNVSINKNYTSEVVKITDKKPIQSVFLSNKNENVVNNEQNNNENENVVNNEQNNNENENVVNNEQNNNENENVVNNEQNNNENENVVNNEQNNNENENVVNNEQNNNENENVVNIPKGLSLISGNINFKDLKNKDVLIVWAINPTTKEWEGYSPYGNIQKLIIKNGYKLLTKINDSRSFFVISKKQTKIKFLNNIKIDNDMDLLNLPEGYSLIGSEGGILDINDIRCNVNYTIGGIYKLKNNKWLKFIPSENIKEFNTIESNEGAIVICVKKRSIK